MNDSKIASAGIAYYVAVNEVKKRRQQWDERVRALIHNTLNSCVVISRLPMTVALPAEYRNHESVVAYFSDETGIYPHPFEKEEIVKRGAQLVFQQLKNGNVIAVSFMPTLDGIGHNIEYPKDDYEEHEPDLLTSERIEEYFIEFIAAVRLWELSRTPSYSNRIGF